MNSDTSPAVLAGTQASSVPSGSPRMDRKGRGESLQGGALAAPLRFTETQPPPQDPHPLLGPGSPSPPPVQHGLGQGSTINSRHHVSSIYGFFSLLLRFSLDECPLSLDLQHPPAVGLMAI